MGSGCWKEVMSFLHGLAGDTEADEISAFASPSRPMHAQDETMHLMSFRILVRTVYRGPASFNPNSENM